MPLIALASSRGRPAIRSVTRCSFAAWQLLELWSGSCVKLWTSYQGTVSDAGASACVAFRVPAISRQGHPARHVATKQDSSTSHAAPPATQQRQQRAASTSRQRSVAQSHRVSEMTCSICRSHNPRQSIKSSGFGNCRKPAATRAAAAAQGSNLEPAH